MTTSDRTASAWVVLAATSLAVFAVFLDTTILFVAFPSISSTFAGTSSATLSWVLNAYTIVFAALLIPAGRLADRVGRRQTFLAAVVVFTVASMLCGLAPSAPWLVATRVLQAAGAAALIPSSLALVLQSFPRERIPVAVAIWGAVGAVAGAAGPTLGALVVDHLGWRWAFFINLPVGIVSFTLGHRVLPEGRERETGALPDAASIGLLVAALALAAYGIVETESWGWVSLPFAATSIGAALLLGAFVWRCRRVPNPLLHLDLFRTRNFRWGNASMFVFAVSFNGMFLSNVLFLTQVWHYPILDAGLVISIGPVIVAVLAPMLGTLAVRVGQRPLVVLGGLFLAAGGATLIMRATTTPDWAGQFLPSTVLVAVGVALVLPQLSSVAVQGLPGDQYGAGSAVVQAVRNLGATFGVALVVAFLAAVAPANILDGFRSVWWLLVGSGIVVSLTALGLRTAHVPGVGLDDARITAEPAAAAAAMAEV